MTIVRWLFAAALAGSIGCASDDDPIEHEADLVSFCDTVCLRNVECFADDPVDCHHRCAEDSAPVEGKLNSEYVSMLESCIAGMECADMQIVGTEPCVDEVDATLAPTAGGKQFCNAVDATSEECGELFGRAVCLQISKQFDEGALKVAEACAQKPCLEIDPCIRDAFGIEKGGTDPCPFTNDGECDEPDLCPPGTDSADCSI